jgi:hypothetical protein
MRFHDGTVRLAETVLIRPPAGRRGSFFRFPRCPPGGADMRLFHPFPFARRLENLMEAARRGAPRVGAGLESAITWLFISIFTSTGIRAKWNGPVVSEGGNY